MELKGIKTGTKTIHKRFILFVRSRGGVQQQRRYALLRGCVEPAPGERPVADPFISVGTPDGSVGVSYLGYPGNVFRPPGSVGV